MRRKLLIVDTETGGIDAGVNALCSLAAVVLLDGAIVDEFYFLIDEGPEGGLIEDAALKVNGITRERIREGGISPSEAVRRLEQFLLKNDLRGQTTIVAHNAAFDVAFMRRLYKQAGVPERFGKKFSYRALCTVAAAMVLDQAERINLPGGSASLDNLTKYFKVELPREDGHDALVDARACAQIFTKMVNMMKVPVASA